MSYTYRPFYGSRSWGPTCSDPFDRQDALVYCATAFLSAVGQEDVTMSVGRKKITTATGKQPVAGV